MCIVYLLIVTLIMLKKTNKISFQANNDMIFIKYNIPNLFLLLTGTVVHSSIKENNSKSYRKMIYCTSVVIFKLCNRFHPTYILY